MIVAAVQNPDFVGDARGVRAKRVMVALDIDDALPLLFVLAHDVAKNAALALAKPFAGGIQFVLDAPGDKNGRGDLRVGMRPLVAGEGSLVFKDGDIFETRIFL